MHSLNDRGRERKCDKAYAGGGGQAAGRQCGRSAPAWHYSKREGSGYMTE